MIHIENLKDLFIEQLKDQYDNENQQLQGLLKLRRLTNTQDLLEAIDCRLEKINNQIKRLEDIFKLLELRFPAKEKHVVISLIQEAFEVSSRCRDYRVRDIRIITALQILNHHNMACYGTLYTYAGEIEWNWTRKLLEASMEEEKFMDRKFSLIALMCVKCNTDHSKIFA